MIGIKRKPSEADAKEGEELLKLFLEKMDVKTDGKSMTSNEDRK